MKRIPKQAYTVEFKELAVKRVKDGESIAVVVRELGLGDQTLRNWVKAAAEGKLKGARWWHQRRWNSPGCVLKSPGWNGRMKL
jgi:transposase-like protein